jgi:hypothetical protein
VIHELAKKLGYRSRDIGETWLTNGDTHKHSSGGRLDMNGGMNGGIH